MWEYYEIYQQTEGIKWGVCDVKRGIRSCKHCAFRVKAGQQVITRVWAMILTVPFIHFTVISLPNNWIALLNWPEAAKTWKRSVPPSLQPLATHSINLHSQLPPGAISHRSREKSCERTWCIVWQVISAVTKRVRVPVRLCTCIREILGSKLGSKNRRTFAEVFRAVFRSLFRQSPGIQVC